jgi:putative ABC transport system permease protein
MRLEHWFYTLPLRLRSLFERQQVEQELNDEFRDHLERLVQQHVVQGLSPEQARQAALREMDGLEQRKEECRDARGVNFIEHFLQDVRFGGRVLRKNPGFTLVAVLALALGIGANSAIFSVVYGVLLRPLPFPDADRLALVYMHFSPQNMEHGNISIADFLDWRAQNRSFEEPALFAVAGVAQLRRFDITGAGEPEQVRGSAVTAGFFPALRVNARLGRLFLPGEDAAGGEHKVVLSESLWRRRFGSRSDAIGQSITLNGAPYTIIGVLPASFQFARMPDNEVWTNLLLNPPTHRGPYFYNGLGRLQPGVTFEQAQAEMNAIGGSIERVNSNWYSRVTMPVVPLREALVGTVRPALLVLFGAVVFVLLIATVNVANLLLARASVREREIAVRAALGAGRWRLIRQLLTESTLLALLGGAVGLFFAYAGVQMVRAWNPGDLPRVNDIHLDGHVLAFTFVISVVIGVLFGLAPAMHSSRGLNAALNEGGRSGTAGAARHRTHAVLMVSEVALSLVLLIGAGLLLRSFSLLQQVKAGFSADPQKVLAVDITLSGAKYAQGKAQVAFFDRLIEQARSLPGVESAALSDSLPPSDAGDSDTFVIEGQPWTQEGFPSTDNGILGPGYLRTLGIPLLKGRDFSDSDTSDSLPVTLISESLARRYFPNDDPIGHRLKQSDPNLHGSPFMEIVGVVGDVKYDGLDAKSDMAYYTPYRQNFARNMYLVVRSGLPAAGLLRTLHQQIRDLDPDVVINSPSTLEQVMSESVAQPRFRTFLLGLFAAIALLLAAIGIYGVIAYSVAQRTHEIGIRMALGAQRVDVLRLVAGRGLRLTLAGLAIGVVVALAVTRLLSTLLFGVGPTDPLTFAAMAVLLCAVAVVACAEPAHRAMRVDPMVALRYE